jgi:hypothetical protein
MKTFLIITILSCQFHLHAQTSKIEISTKNNSDREKEILNLLNELLVEYDLSKWIFTNKVLIEQRIIPHSHPVLTLNTSSTDKKDILTTFIHEQLHWYVEKNPESEKRAIAKFKERYKNVPYQNRAGAKDEYSTYLHLIVCYLEYRSMASLIGETEAKQLMWNMTHYTWVYNKIIDDAGFIRNVLKEGGFDLVD